MKKASVTRKPRKKCKHEYAGLIFSSRSQEFYLICNKCGVGLTANFRSKK
jgi:hypothetical protein